MKRPWRSDRPFPWTACYKVALGVCFVVAVAFAGLVIAELLLPTFEVLDPLFDAFGG